ncbi:MOSC domain-containing protein [Bacillus carboniphilus]|uniref:MOSC domain-containing protein n=1 Tax=Bacillus carboniphilus TaxID=86663 RepID=A0ABY9JQ13_9BACI|nr:MOSC domain-containing protein [Bacillus carboniphilus]WLR41471.1 MOSC domain-containing protein [Bacillus carboniphilus]
MTRKLVHLAVGKPKEIQYGEDKTMYSGIGKSAIKEVYLSKEGFHHDGVANTKFHGGPDRAVCFYSYEHYSMWEREYGVILPKAAFGENVTAINMHEKDVCIGGVYQLGEAIVQVSQGRIPCQTITKRTTIDLSRVIDTGYTGFFCRVLSEGVVREDSPIDLLESHPNNVTILYANQVFFHQKNNVKGMERILKVEPLAEVWREKLTKRLEKIVSIVD